MPSLRSAAAASPSSATARCVASSRGGAGVRVVGRIPQEEVAGWIAAADVLCQPSLREPFGQGTLEGLAMERTVVATTVGGPPEFVTPEAGVLVDPLDEAALAEALGRAAAMPAPNAKAREAAAAHDVRIQVARMARRARGRRRPRPQPS